MITATQVKHYVNDKRTIEFWCETTLQDAIIEIAENSSLNRIDVRFYDLPDCYNDEDVLIDILSQYVKKWGYVVEVIYTDQSEDGHVLATILW